MSRGLVNSSRKSRSIVSIVQNFGLAYASSILSLLTTLLVARAAGPENYSSFALGLAAGGMFAVLSNLGMQLTFVRDAVRSTSTRAVVEIAYEGLSRRLSAYLLIALCLLGAAFLLLGNSFSEGSQVFLVACWAGLIGLYPHAWYDHDHRSHEQLKVVLGERMATLILVGGALLMAGGQALLLVAFIMLLVRLVSVVWQVQQWKGFHREDASAARVRLVNPMRQARGTSVAVMIPLFANTLLTHGTQLFLVGYENPVEIAVYSIAFSLMSVVMISQGQFIRFINRQVAESLKTDGRASLGIAIRRYCVWMGGASLLVGTVLYLVSPLLVFVLGDARYIGLQPLLIPLAGWIAVIGIGKVVTQYLIEMNQERYYLVNGILGSGIALGLAAWLVPLYGGMAVATILFVVRSIMTLSNVARLRHSIRMMKPGV